MLSSLTLTPHSTADIIQVYNWGGGGGYIAGDSAGDSFANIINNVFISGPSTSVTACECFICIQDNPPDLLVLVMVLVTRGNANFHAYVSNNYYDPDKAWTYGKFE